MDCRTARLFFTFFQPGSTAKGEMDPGDIESLDAHLVQCPECAALARAERAVDERLGRAMRQVEVPAGLRTQILARLAAERGNSYRRRFGQGMRIAAAIAAVLLLAWGWWVFYPSPRPVLDLTEVLEQTNVIRPGPDEIFASWERLGVPTVPPQLFNYAFLTGHGLAELPGYPGKKVPVMEFARDGSQRARVYIVSDTQFDLRSLDQPPPTDPGYVFRLQVRFGPNKHEGYLVLYTGDSIDWLLQDRHS